MLVMTVERLSRQGSALHWYCPLIARSRSLHLRSNITETHVTLVLPATHEPSRLPSEQIKSMGDLGKRQLSRSSAFPSPNAWLHRLRGPAHQVIYEDIYPASAAGLTNEADEEPLEMVAKDGEMD